MNKHRVGIGGSVAVSPVKGMADGAAMIGAVVDQMKDRFLTAQHALLAIHENEANGLLKLLRRKTIEIRGQPLIGRRQPAVKLIELGQGIGVGAAMGRRLPKQPSAEQLLNANQMVELLPSKSQRLVLLQRIELSDCVQYSTVSSGFILESIVREHQFGLTRCLRGRDPKNKSVAILF